jgi:hypothetical protein
VVNGQHTVVVRPLSLLAISISDHKNFRCGGGWSGGGVLEGVVCQVLPTPKGEMRTEQSHLGSDATGKATG